MRSSVKSAILGFFACTLATLVSCTKQDTPHKTHDPGPELVHSIHEYDVEYRTRAEAVVKELTQHWASERYVRWRPVRVVPNEILNGDFLNPGAMPTSVCLSPFPDVNIQVRQTGYHVFEHINQALWTGKVIGVEHPTVEIVIISMEEGPAFVIKAGVPPKSYGVTATDSLDVYVAFELAPFTGETFD